MEVAVVTGLFAEWNMDVDAGHILVISGQCSVFSGQCQLRN